MEQTLEGKSVAILIANGFEEVAMATMQKALLAASATVKVISPENNLVNGWHGKGWGHYFPVDASIATTLAADFDALIVPDGERSIDKLAGNPHTKRIVKGFTDGAKATVLYGHGARVLALADRATGRSVARDDATAEALAAGGAVIVDDGVVRDDSVLSIASDVPVEDALAQILALIAENDGPPRVAEAA